MPYGHHLDPLPEGGNRLVYRISAPNIVPETADRYMVVGDRNGGTLPFISQLVP
jgi:hypothetical protein